MKKSLFALAALVALCSHDMFLRLDTYFLEPNAAAEVKLYNGTFEESGNFIRRERMGDISLVSGGTRTTVDTARWSNRDSMTVLSITTGEPGTYVAGVSLDPWNIELAAADFNDYLASDGGADMLASRTAEGLLEEDAVEQYAKHTKVIFQVGDTKTDDWSTALGYPIEFVPMSNPYDLHPGEDLQVKLLFGGRPLANHLVLVGSVESHDHDHAGDNHVHADGTEHATDHDHDHADVAAAAPASATHGHKHAPTQELRTDADGVVAFTAAHDGFWHLRTIHMVKSAAEGLTHESNWATLSFEVSHDRSHADGAHAHDGDHDDGGVPGYVYWIGSLLVVGGLFYYFNRKR